MANNDLNKKTTDILFWNVDTQYDFMRNDESFRGALPVDGARGIEENLGKLTMLAEKNNIKVVNTADWHDLSDAEIDPTSADFKSTYPEHCMANTKGAKYVPATHPKNPYVVSMDDNFTLGEYEVLSTRNIVLHKNKFDVFSGNPYTTKVLELLNPKRVFVYGVATNVCVNFAVEGLLNDNRDVYVVFDAIKELPKEIAATSLENVLMNWERNGVKFTTVKELAKIAKVKVDV